MAKSMSIMKTRRQIFLLIIDYPQLAKSTFHDRYEWISANTFNEGQI